MERNTEFYLQLLYKLLLEIRNMEAHELKFAPHLAYIFHNVPSLLKSNFNGTSGEKEWEVIRSRAKQLNLLPVIDAWSEQILAEKVSRNNR